MRSEPGHQRSFVTFGDPSDHDLIHPTHNPPGRHAWVVVGDETIFLCHLIMGWMQGHNYEVVLEVSLPDEVVEAIRADRGDSREGNTHFLGNQGDPSTGHNGDAGGSHPRGGSDAQQSTAGEASHERLRPAYSIPRICSGGVTTFVADIWNYFPSKKCGMGWPYPPDTEFLKDVPVTVNRVVHYRHVNLNLLAQRSESYLLFGRGDEAHLYHNIVDQPDYDHVVSLARVPEWVQEEQLEAGVIVSVPSLPWSAESTRCTNPLAEGRTYPVLYHGIRRYRDPTLKNSDVYGDVPPLEIEVGRTWWFSTRVVNWPPEGPCGNLGDIPTPRWPEGAECPPAKCSD